MEFSVESVLAMYEKLQNGLTRTVKNEANERIVAFL